MSGQLSIGAQRHAPIVFAHHGRPDHPDAGLPPALREDRLPPCFERAGLLQPLALAVDRLAVMGHHQQSGLVSHGKRGDDMIGLTRAFMYAGAPTVIASLWKVDDLATYEFMTAFYEQLQHGKSKAAALRNAQKLTRQTYPYPYYWAAFMLTGEPGN